ncbi:MAG: hypothetical protein E6J54_21075 [Deltaproteobacteria bacterium]|nr:MAG: hypothetical protein E6J54_21075 [Deltaproteobacteria bacterium]
MPQAKVTESDVLPALLAVCPSFRQCWDEYVSDEAYVPNQVYVDAGEFARHMCVLLQAGTVNELSAVFAAVEHLLEEGDEDACNAVTTGLLEDVYFEAEDAGISPREWRKYFGPRATRAWEAYLVWAKKSD